MVARVLQRRYTFLYNLVLDHPDRQDIVPPVRKADVPLPSNVGARLLMTLNITIRRLNSITTVTRYLVDVRLADRALTVVSSLTTNTPCWCGM